MKRILVTLFSAGLSLMGLTLVAQPVPQLINYQGQLLDASGAPLTGDQEISIRLYSAESGGALLWGPQTFNGQTGTGFGAKVSVVNGNFNLILGPKDTTNKDLSPVFAANSLVFLEVKVGNNNPISPRQQILSAPFALKAQSTDKLGNFAWGDLFDNGNPSTGKIPKAKIDFVNGNLGLGLAAPTLRLDVNGRMRVRQETDTAGIWFHQKVGADRAFVGMVNDDEVGFYGAGYGWGVRMNVTSGVTSFPAAISTSAMDLGLVRFDDASFFIPDGVFGIRWIRIAHINGGANFDGSVCASNVSCASDQRIKKDLEDIADPVEKIQALRAVEYSLDSTSDVFKKANLVEDSDRRTGVLAQDVERVLPSAVRRQTSGLLTVDYNALTSVLIEAVKEQQRQIETLKGEVSVLKGLSSAASK